MLAVTQNLLNEKNYEKIRISNKVKKKSNRKKIVKLSKTSAIFEEDCIIRNKKNILRT